MRAEWLSASLLACAACTALAAQPLLKFRFTGRVAPGEVLVDTRIPYAGSYGVEPGATRSFSVALPEGAYRVTVSLGDVKLATRTTIKAESRRLMLRDVQTKAGQFVTRSFVVDVRTAQLPAPPENAPGAAAVRLNAREAGSRTWDDRLTLEVLGSNAHLAALTIQPAQLPRLFLMGDSTVADQGAQPYASWGQMLPVLFGPDVVVANHAESGETLKSFLAELRLDKALASMKSGDFVLLQFGHNDQKSQWPQTYAAAASTYRAYLRVYIAEIRLRGATPLLVTPPERRSFNAAGRIAPSLADYAEAMRAVAGEEKVTLLDLNVSSMRFYEALGPERAALAFADGGKDSTHHNDYGAFVLASLVADAIRTSGSPLAALLMPGLAPFDAASPVDPETFGSLE